MSKEKMKCPRCGSDYLIPGRLSLSDRIVSLISNDHIKHVRCMHCLWEGRAHLSKRHHRHQRTASGN